MCFYFEFLASGPGFGSGQYFIQWSRIICTILVEVIMGNICRNYFEFGQVVLEMLLFILFKSIFSSGGHFVQQSGTICAILVKGIDGNVDISVKLIQS